MEFSYLNLTIKFFNHASLFCNLSQCASQTLNHPVCEHSGVCGPSHVRARARSSFWSALRADPHLAPRARDRGAKKSLRDLFRSAQDENISPIHTQ